MKTPIELAIEPFLPELRAIAQAIRDSQTATCSQCSVETKCEAAWNGRFVCISCYRKLMPKPRP
jgi:hypothetical protein